MCAGRTMEHPRANSFFRRRIRPFWTWALLPIALVWGCSDATGPGTEEGGWVQVVAGEAHACALTHSGRVYCWGNTSAGQAGRQLGPVLTPTRVESDLEFTQIAAGGKATCGLAEDGSLHCWGLNVMGQLGNASGQNSFRPVAVEGGITWSSVSVGTYHTCGIDVEGSLICWGADRWDVALGVPATFECTAPAFEPTWPCEKTPNPLRSVGTFDWVEAGLYQTCAGSAASGALNGMAWPRTDHPFASRHRAPHTAAA